MRPSRPPLDLEILLVDLVYSVAEIVSIPGKKAKQVMQWICRSHHRHHQDQHQDQNTTTTHPPEDDQQQHDTHHLINRYLRSQPRGPPRETKDHRWLMAQVRRFHDGQATAAEERRLQRALVARLAMDRRANLYAGALGLYRLPPIEAWDASSPRGRSPGGRGYHTASGSYYSYRTFRAFVRMLVESGLFQPVGEYYGPHYYRRPAQYLAAAMAAAGYDREDVRRGIERLETMRRERRFWAWV
ncbi:hypothetical protein VTN02DRAFT_5758 [Thermoascus thermophilus]